VVARQTETFGPILTERAETIGKHKLFVGFSYQYFNFDKADGINLKNFGAVFQHESESGLCNPGSPFTCVNGEPIFQNDIIGTQNRVDLKVHQFTVVGTFGLTDRLDLSVAVPILDVRMGMISNATITSFESSTDFPPCCLHRFDPSNNDPHETLLPADPTFGFNHAIFSNANSSSGIGDVVFRGKFQAIRGEKAGVALGVDLHTPTGDAHNFLGSGTWGVRPFITASYAARISPHATLGYQRNGDSILAGDITTNKEAHLPDIITYSAGVDAGLTHRISVTGDFLGQSLLDEKKIAAATFTDFAGTQHATLTTSTATVNQAGIAVGTKIRLLS
jgi:hypothetical protein